MPLPFLTAERAPETVRDALPHATEDHWRRPYRLGGLRVGIAAVLLLLASYMLMSAVIIALAGGPAAASVTLGLAVVTIVFALRILRIGIWVSPQGLRQVNLLTTRTVRWRDISRVSTAQQPVKWLGLPRTVQGQALLIERRRGEPLRTLLTDRNSDFLRRPDAFDRAVPPFGTAWGTPEAGGRSGEYRPSCAGRSLRPPGGTGPGSAGRGTVVVGGCRAPPT